MTENTVMWPTAGIGAPGPAFFVPEENDAILYSATAEMDSYTLKSTFAFRE